jgi:hypothetical protein
MESEISVTQNVASYFTGCCIINAADMPKEMQ